MGWKKTFRESAGDILRFMGYAFLAFDLIAISIFSLWFVCRFLHRLAGWFDRIMFDRPW